jgi:hypothetical protein
MTLVTVVTLVLAGGVAFASTNSSTKRKTRSGSVLASERGSETPLIDAKTLESAPYAVRTVVTTMYDATRDRTITVTVYAPDTDGEFPLVVMVTARGRGVGLRDPRHPARGGGLRGGRARLPPVEPRGHHVAVA